MLADSVDLATLDLVSVTNGILTKVHAREGCAARGRNCDSRHAKAACCQWDSDPTSPDSELQCRTVSASYLAAVWSSQTSLIVTLLSVPRGAQASPTDICGSVGEVDAEDHGRAAVLVDLAFEHHADPRRYAVRGHIVRSDPARRVAGPADVPGRDVTPCSSTPALTS